MSNKEDKRTRFKNLAARRTNAVLEKLNTLGNCANRNTYDYTEEEVKKIFSEIEKRVKEVKLKFHVSKDEEFKL